jgi:hypothetical protein
MILRGDFLAFMVVIDDVVYQEDVAARYRRLLPH